MNTNDLERATSHNDIAADKNADERYGPEPGIEECTRPLCKHCGKGTPADWIPLGTKHIMGNQLATGFRDTHLWRVMRCPVCGHIEWFFNPQ